MPVIIKTPHGDATEVGLQYFFDRVLPLPRYDIHVDTIFAQYDVTGRTPLPPTKSGGLSDNVANGLPLLEGDESVAPVFESIPACARRLARALPHSWVASLDVEDNEDSEWSLENRAYDALPDAYFLDRTRYPTEPVDWTNIVVPGVYSKEDTSEAAEENNLKIARCMTHCMNRDPCRRFVYAFSKEGTTMRLWYCNRSYFFVTTPFDFAADRRIVFYFILSTVYASLLTVGIDTDMRPVGRDD